MPGLVLSNLAGLARQILVARAFGTGTAIDAFLAANRLPELLFNLVAGGALSSAFIPTYTGFLTRRDRVGADRLTSAISTWVFTILLGLSVLSACFSVFLVSHVIAPLLTDPAEIRLTAGLLRLLLLSPTVFALSGLVMAVLNAHQRFFISALAPMFYPLGMILAVFVLVPRLGIYGLAWGAVGGALLHLLVQVPSLLQLRTRYRPTYAAGDPAVREVARLMAPRLIGQGAIQLNFLVNTILATGQPEGSLAALGWAFSLMLMPEIAIAQASAIAALPTFSAQASRGELGEMRSSLASTLRGVLFLAAPASLGLILLRQPLVALVFERGSFNAGSTRMVAWALLFYAAGLVAHSTLEVLSRAFYALHDTLTPVMVSLGGMLLNVLLSLGLVRSFSARGWMPHGGLALANTLATFTEMAVLAWMIRPRLGGLAERHDWISFGHTALATGVMGAGLWWWQRALGSQPAWLSGGLGILFGGAIFWLAALALGSREARRLPRLLFERLLRRKGFPS